MVSTLAIYLTETIGENMK